MCHAIFNKIKAIFIFIFKQNGELVVLVVVVGKNKQLNYVNPKIGVVVVKNVAVVFQFVIMFK